MSTHRSPNKKSALERLREEITIDTMRHVLEELLAQSGKRITEADSWPQVLVQIRISRADTRDGVSESPARQLRIIAKYCVEYGFQPWEMCFEAQSGSLTDRYPAPPEPAELREHESHPMGRLRPGAQLRDDIRVAAGLGVNEPLKVVGIARIRRGCRCRHRRPQVHQATTPAAPCRPPGSRPRSVARAQRAHASRASPPAR